MTSSVIYSGEAAELLDRVDRDGFFVLPSFFDPQAVDEARNEIEPMLEESERKHLEAKARDARDRLGFVDASTPFKSIYEPNLHTQFFFSHRSPKYARLLNDFFESKVMQGFIKGLAGTMHLRVDVCQRAQGLDDSTGQVFQGPLPWHRDTPGEFTFGIFLEDSSQPGWGGTTFIPGSHRNPLNPRWDLLAGDKENFTSLDLYDKRELRFMPDELLRFGKLNQMLRKRLASKVVEATGGIGGVYLFLNDTWHGRAANRTGKRKMASRFGGFATDFSFKDDIKLPEGTQNLPDGLRRAYLGPHEKNTDPNTLLRRLEKVRTHEAMTYLAAKEKKLLVGALVRKKQADKILEKKVEKKVA